MRTSVIHFDLMMSCNFALSFNMFCDMIDKIIDYILSPLMGDGYKAGGIKTHPLVPKDIVVRGFIIDSETGALEKIL